MSGSSEQCPYRVLGVASDSTPRDIKAAYRASRALQTHPDRAEPHRRASSEEDFKVLLRAYELLSDPIRRAQYDHNCTAHLCPAQAPRPQSAAPQVQPQQQQGRRHQKAASTSASSNYAPFPGIPRAFPHSPPAPPPMSGFQTFAWSNQMPAWAPPPSEPPPPHFLSRMDAYTKPPPAPAFQGRRSGHQPYDEATTLAQPFPPLLESAFEPEHFDEPFLSGKESRQDDWVHASRFARCASSFSAPHAAPHESGAAWNSDWQGQSAAPLPSASRLSSTARHCPSTFRLHATLTGMRRDDGLVFDGSLHAEYRQK
ncbi:DnaJ-domain-containing protein [Ceraceosorus guamensis]|uniref:DnaJ-domain-containing protein n=1 Tax=Ceraceosorus guamensis TaxID=1522189 RepID=A0A316VQV0_9BASI|nr:DnaJ-domain-containing protein [Ceraceosorus guamensis]PWN39720.1 DnaJ-domain-containing protein [Ceraceosorus guamensis]